MLGLAQGTQCGCSALCCSQILPSTFPGAATGTWLVSESGLLISVSHLHPASGVMDWSTLTECQVPSLGLSPSLPICSLPRWQIL